MLPLLSPASPISVMQKASGGIALRHLFFLKKVLRMEKGFFTAKDSNFSSMLRVRVWGSPPRIFPLSSCCNCVTIRRSSPRGAQDTIGSLPKTLDCNVAATYTRDQFCSSENIFWATFLMLPFPHCKIESITSSMFRLFPTALRKRKK